MLNQKKKTVLTNIPPVINFGDTLFREASFNSNILELHAGQLKFDQLFTSHVKDLIQKGVAIIRVKLE